MLGGLKYPIHFNRLHSGIELIRFLKQLFLTFSFPQDYYTERESRRLVTRFVTKFCKIIFTSSSPCCLCVHVYVHVYVINLVLPRAHVRMFLRYR